MDILGATFNYFLQLNFLRWRLKRRISQKIAPRRKIQLYRISPFERAWSFIWTNLNSLHPMVLCTQFGWNKPSGSEEKILKILLMYFPNFVIISPWKRVGSFIWTNLNLLYQRMLCAKFDWNWPSVTGEDRRKCEKFTTITTTTAQRTMYK